MQRKRSGVHDQLIADALAAGEFSVDPATGHIADRNGRPRDTTVIRGYRQVSIRRTLVRAHRMVWIACEGPIPDGMQINHRNRIRDDNRICNLEVVDAGENAAHAAGTPYYERLRDDDLAAVDPKWLEQVLALAERGDVSPDDVAALRPEPRGPVGSPEYRHWQADQRVDQVLSGAR